MQKEEQYQVEKHLVDCELCKDALSGMALIPDYQGIDKIRKEIRRLAETEAGYHEQDVLVGSDHHDHHPHARYPRCPLLYKFYNKDKVGFMVCEINELLYNLTHAPLSRERGIRR